MCERIMYALMFPPFRLSVIQLDASGVVSERLISFGCDQSEKRVSGADQASVRPSWSDSGGDQSGVRPGSFLRGGFGRPASSPAALFTAAQMGSGSETEVGRWGGKPGSSSMLRQETSHGRAATTPTPLSSVDRLGRRIKRGVQLQISCR